jgi:hypothetical protein
MASDEKSRQFFFIRSSLKKNRHAFRARTFDYFFSLRGYGQTHTKQKVLALFFAAFVSLRGTKEAAKKSYFSAPSGRPPSPAPPRGRPPGRGARGIVKQVAKVY